MNADNATAISALRLLIILAMIGAAVYLLFRIPKMFFNSPVAKGQVVCTKDKHYYFKDPQNHPYDC